MKAKTFKQTRTAYAVTAAAAIPAVALGLVGVMDSALLMFILGFMLWRVRDAAIWSSKYNGYGFYAVLDEWMSSAYFEVPGDPATLRLPEVIPYEKMDDKLFFPPALIDDLFWWVVTCSASIITFLFVLIQVIDVPIGMVTAIITAVAIVLFRNVAYWLFQGRVDHFRFTKEGMEEVLTRGRFHPHAISDIVARVETEGWFQ